MNRQRIINTLLGIGILSSGIGLHLASNEIKSLSATQALSKCVSLGEVNSFEELMLGEIKASREREDSLGIAIIALTPNPKPTLESISYQLDVVASELHELKGAK